jgi:hypothetical protein
MWRSAPDKDCRVNKEFLSTTFLLCFCILYYKLLFVASVTLYEAQIIRCRTILFLLEFCLRSHLIDSKLGPVLEAFSVMLIWFCSFVHLIYSAVLARSHYLWALVKCSFLYVQLVKRLTALGRGKDRDDEIPETI